MLKGKTALITGANGGIGRAIIHALAEQHADMIVHARKECTDFTEELRQIQSCYAINIVPVYFDVVESSQIQDRLKQFILGGNTIDILVNTVGVAHIGLFQTTPITKIREIFEINLFSCMEITQIVLRAMMRKKSGAIVNIASIAGQDLNAGVSAYGVSKAAVIAWTQVLAAETASFGIRVNAIAPGMTDTRMAMQMGEKAGKAVIENSAMKRLAKPEEIASAVVFLASDNASFINGQTLRVDGGHI